MINDQQNHDKYYRAYLFFGNLG